MVRFTWNFIGTSAYQERLPVLKENVSMTFISSPRLVNVYLYQNVLQPSIDTMLFAWVLQEFQTHADHTQDVRNQNQGYQYISPDLYFTINTTCQDLGQHQYWNLPKRHRHYVNIIH